jgi:hypothetical protein
MQTESPDRRPEEDLTRWQVGGIIIGLATILALAAWLSR